MASVRAKSSPTKRGSRPSPAAAALACRPSSGITGGSGPPPDGTGAPDHRQTRRGCQGGWRWRWQAGWTGKVAIISGGATGMGGAASPLRRRGAPGSRSSTAMPMPPTRRVAAIPRRRPMMPAFPADVRRRGPRSRRRSPPQPATLRPGDRALQPCRHADREAVPRDHRGGMGLAARRQCPLDVFVTRAVLPGMIAAGGGSIVCTSS